MAAEQQIEQILYISTVAPAGKVNLESLLATARRNNHANNITGLLMFNGKRFLQVLEGPSDAVTATYDRISHDIRHRAPVLLARRTVKRREFGDWSMGFRSGAQAEGSEIYDSICAKVAAANPNLRAELMAFARQI